MRSKKINTYILCTALAVVILITSFVGGGARFARAATTTSAVEAFEAQNVWEDLHDATIDGEGIDLTLYNFDEHKSVQLISFVEFCYSFRSDKQNNYGLYIYVYNPRGYDWTATTYWAQNKIQLRTGGNSSANFEKYRLQYLNKSEESGYEGLFYKFKIVLSGTQRSNILASLNSNSRIYEISGIELYSSSYNATEYDVSNIYTYTGFAKGYGAEGVESDSLNCKSSGLVTLTLDVHSAVYRPEGTNGKNEYTQDSLHSVYFSVPNKILDEYDGLSAVHATWLNARTTPIYVTGNNAVYQKVYQNVMLNYGTPVDSEYALLVNAQEIKTAMPTPTFRYDADIGYNVDGVGLQGNSSKAYGIGVVPSKVGNIFYCLFAEGGDADNCFIGGDKVLEFIKQYTEEAKVTEIVETGSGPTHRPGQGNSGSTTPGVSGGGFGGGGGSGRSTEQGLVAGKYKSELFSNVDEEFTEVNIHANDKHTLTSEKLDKNFWEKVFGGSHVVSSSFSEVEAIHKVVPDDFYSDEELTCKNLYIHKNYYKDFKSFYDKAKSRNETVFLFRFYQDEYESREVTEFARTTEVNGLFQPSITGGDVGLKYLDTNAFMAQMTVNLDFDIIDVTCSKGEVNTVIPCIMSPIDFVPPLTPPVITTPDFLYQDWWKYALTATVALVAVTIGATFVEKRTKKMHEEER